MIKRNINSFFINLIASLINMSKFDKNTYIIDDINIFSVVNILVLSKAFIRDFKSCMITLRRYEKMENKIEYKILDDKIIVYFYGELSSSNVSKYRNLINNILDKK